MRRKDDSLRETLLDLARQVSDAEGIEAVNIRALAGKAGVAIGTVYNYFSDKGEILHAVAETYWRQALNEMKTAITADSFCGQLQEIFTFLNDRINQSAGKFMDGIVNMGAAGQTHMTSIQSALETAIIQRLEEDVDIRKDIWNESFTKEQFAHFIMMNMLLLLKMQVQDITFFVWMIKRAIY